MADRAMLSGERFVRSILIDTGPIVALLNKRERFHAQARELFNSLRPSDTILTTWPVVTEVSFLIKANRTALWQWLDHSGIVVQAFTLTDVTEMWRLMQPHDDREVDFADASLVWLAVHCGTDLIATTDFNDFETYRLPGKRPFRLLFSRASRPPR